MANDKKTTGGDTAAKGKSNGAPVKKIESGTSKGSKTSESSKEGESSGKSKGSTR